MRREPVYPYQREDGQLGVGGGSWDEQRPMGGEAEALYADLEDAEGRRRALAERARLYPDCRHPQLETLEAIASGWSWCPDCWVWLAPAEAAAVQPA